MRSGPAWMLWVTLHDAATGPDPASTRGSAQVWEGDEAYDQHPLFRYVQCVRHRSD